MSWTSPPTRIFQQSMQCVTQETTQHQLHGSASYTPWPTSEMIPQYHPARLPPIRGHAEEPYRSTKALKISDLLSSEDVLPKKQTSQHGYLCGTPAPPLRIITPAQSRAPTQPQWDDFIERMAIERPTSSNRPQSRDQYWEKASYSSVASQMSSPSAYSIEASHRLSPSIVAVSSVARTVAPPLFNYNLSFRQQPKAARACGHGDRDRRVIDPPPILELKITHQIDDTPAQDLDAFFALHCSLIDAESGKRAAHDDIESCMTNSMMGASAASPFHGKDEHGNAGTFFIFSDLSCRYQGRFRLHFELLRIDRGKMLPGAKHGIVASMDTEVFTAYTAKDFPGMQESTRLLMALRRQGLTVGIKKGSDARKLKGKLRRGSSGSYSSGSDGSAKKLKGKRKARDSRGGSPDFLMPGTKMTTTAKQRKVELVQA